MTTAQQISIRFSWRSDAEDSITFFAHRAENDWVEIAQFADNRDWVLVFSEHEGVSRFDWIDERSMIRFANRLARKGRTFEHALATVARRMLLDGSWS